MSDRGEKAWRVDIIWEPEYRYRIVRAKSEEEAVEKFKDEHAHEMLHNWIRYEVEEEDIEE